LRFRMFFGSFSGHGAANRLSLLSGATLRLGHRHAVHPIKTGKEVMASPDVRTALDLQAIVFATISKARDIRHGRLRRPAGRRLAPQLWRAARRMECVQPGWLPVAFPCYQYFEPFSDMGMQVVSGGRKIRFGYCTLDDGRGVLLAPNGTETLLRPKTLELLRLFLRNPGRVVGRSEILDAVWPGLFVSDDSITQCVVELRRAMGEVGTALLRTVPRRGYLLQAPVMVEEDKPVSALALLPPVQDDIPSIAVLPFRKFQHDPENAYFADGIVEGIVHVLSGLDRLRVISRGSALALAERTVDPREIGRALGVRYVLYGGVQRAGDRLRISTELSESETGNIIRTDRHDGDMADLFALQDRIAEQAVATITPTVREHELQRALRKPPANLTAYDLVLRALDRFHRLDRESFDQAREVFQQAIIADPSSALAYGYLSWWHALRLAQGWSSDVEFDRASAAKAGLAAVERDPNDALALAAHGYELGYGQRDFAAAEVHLNRAVAISPSCALAWCFGAAIRCWTDRGPEAVEWGERAIRLAPHDNFAFLYEHILSQAYYTAGNLDAAISWGQRSAVANPRHAANLRTIVASLVGAGRAHETPILVQRIMDIEPNMSLEAFLRRTPLQGTLRDQFAHRLRLAGLPD
jgi:TolB-like protein